MKKFILTPVFLMMLGCGAEVANTKPITQIKEKVSSIPAIKGLVWLESFEGLKNGDMKDKGKTAWTATLKDDDAKYAEFVGVRDGAFHANVTQSEVVWKSQEIDISNTGGVIVSVEVEGVGGLDNDPDAIDFDYFRFYCVVDGGAEKEIGKFHGEIPIGQGVLKSNKIKGKKLRIIIRALNTGYPEDYFWDNVKVMKAN
jgi:hypothetical protein